MMFNHYQNVLINIGDEVNADIRQLCQEAWQGINCSGKRLK